MRTVLTILLTSLVVACADSGGDPDTDADPQRVCDEVVEGRYHASQGFGMPMDVELAFDADACEFTLDDWSAPDQPGVPMSHSNSPEGGYVDEGTLVQLYGPAQDPEDCPGEVLDEGTRIAGDCGGEPYELTLKE